MKGWMGLLVPMSLVIACTLGPEDGTSNSAGADVEDVFANGLGKDGGWQPPWMPAPDPDGNDDSPYGGNQYGGDQYGGDQYGGSAEREPYSPPRRDAYLP
jgi:hypothetical protein